MKTKMGNIPISWVYKLEDSAPFKLKQICDIDHVFVQEIRSLLLKHSDGSDLTSGFTQTCGVFNNKWENRSIFTSGIL